MPNKNTTMPTTTYEAKVGIGSDGGAWRCCLLCFQDMADSPRADLRNEFANMGCHRAVVVDVAVDSNIAATAGMAARQPI
jgi:hypothetical protein